VFNSFTLLTELRYLPVNSAHCYPWRRGNPHYKALEAWLTWKYSRGVISRGVNHELVCAVLTDRNWCQEFGGEITFLSLVIWTGNEIV